MQSPLTDLSAPILNRLPTVLSGQLHYGIDSSEAWDVLLNLETSRDSENIKHRLEALVILEVLVYLPAATSLEYAVEHSQELLRILDNILVGLENDLLLDDPTKVDLSLTYSDQLANVFLQLLAASCHLKLRSLWTRFAASKEQRGSHMHDDMEMFFTSVDRMLDQALDGLTNEEVFCHEDTLTPQDTTRSARSIYDLLGAFRMAVATEHEWSLGTGWSLAAGVNFKVTNRKMISDLLSDIWASYRIRGPN